MANLSGAGDQYYRDIFFENRGRILIGIDIDYMTRSTHVYLLCFVLFWDCDAQLIYRGFDTLERSAI